MLLPGRLEGKPLSGPELEVLRAAAEGLSAKETAEKLVKSQHTVIAQRRAIQAKLGGRNLSQCHRVSLPAARASPARTALNDEFGAHDRLSVACLRGSTETRSDRPAIASGREAVTTALECPLGGNEKPRR